MIIKSVEVKNFRSIRETILDCDNLTAIIGRNGAGKSSFLHAINTFYDIFAQITEEDFFNRDTSAPIEIQVTYSDLRDDEKEEFKSFIKEDEFIITKRISFEDGRLMQRYFAAALQIPQFAKIRSISSKKEKINAWKELVSSGELDNLNGKSKSSEGIEGIRGQGEEKSYMQAVNIFELEEP
jgi:AAA15 family ATPase/GTPase